MQVEHALRQNFHCRIVRRHEIRARHYAGNRGKLGLQHDGINIGLRAAESTIDGKATRDVRRIALKLAARINQQQIAILEFLVIGAVVQHTSICSAGDYSRIGRCVAAMATKLVQQFGFDFKLMLTGFGKAHGACMGCGRNTGGAAHGGYFIRILYQAHRIKFGRDIAHDARRALAIACLGANCLQRFVDARIPLRITPDRIPQRRLVGDQFDQT